MTDLLLPAFRLGMNKIFILGLLILFSVHSCKNSDLVEVKETSVPAEYLVQSIIEVYSTFDVLDDFISSHELLRKKDELLIPNSVQFLIYDSSFSDGDGIEFSLEFGELGGAAPYGVLCKDNKYRAGRVDVKISANYKSEDAVVQVLFGDYHPFYSGDGNEMCRYKGTILIEKEGVDKFNIISNGLSLTHPTGEIISFSCSNSVVKTEDYGLGILNDKIEIDGSFHITVPGGASYEATIHEHLKKNYINGCVKNIVSGKIEMDLSNSASEISADFDPYDDEACDNIVELIINNKSTIFEY